MELVSTDDNFSIIEKILATKVHKYVNLVGIYIYLQYRIYLNTRIKESFKIWYLHFLWKIFSTSISPLYAETILSVDYLVSITCCFIWSWWCDLVCSLAGQRYLKFIHSVLQFKKEYSKLENSRFAKQKIEFWRVFDINVYFYYCYFFSKKFVRQK